MSLDRYLEHLAYEKRCSAHTVQAYRRDLQQFAGFLEGMGVGLEAATGKLVRGWMMGLLEQGIGARSVNRKLSALRGYYTFLRTVGVLTEDPTALIDPPKTPKRLPEFVELGRMDRLFDDLKWPEGAKGERDRLILELLYSTGMRLAELLGLGVGDVDLHRATVKVLGKRNKERIVPLTPALCERLRAYLVVRAASGVGERGPLLVDEKGQPLARRSVQRLVVYYLSGVTSQRKRSPHVLRHTFATHMLDQGADLNAVKELLGHAGLAATQVYTHNTVEKLRNVHAQAHPRGGGVPHEPSNER
ncbi:MAG: tyrosine-type recombinase/integrase [Flavobacteriales bacterium]|nr:tyrosine-type recombinase/integrase [Flavobacteriales bacterium]